ncbi:MAG: sodium:proton antiporter NhaD [Methylohalobius sp. ZOD2]
MFRSIFTFLVLFALAPIASASEWETLGLVTTERGIYCVLLFAIAYILVMAEEFIELKKSKPVIIAAILIWAEVAYMASTVGVGTEELHGAIAHNLAEYGELMLFLLVAMTYINAMANRNVFERLRSWLLSRNFGYRKLFWITGVITFFLSSVADNLTSALLIGAVVLAVGKDNLRFVALGLINLVVAANAGGAFSPFGDITTLMVWQAEKATFFQFLELFLPSVVNYLIPAAVMSFAIPDEQPEQSSEGLVPLKIGAYTICGLFALTITFAVSFKQFLHLPPFMGMMLGWGVLAIFGFWIKFQEHDLPHEKRFDIFDMVREAEWDTLLFFFGVIFCVAGLGFIGYMGVTAQWMYGDLGPTFANILVGFLSAIVDNIPVMFAVLSMEPDMDLYQWLLVTLTAGVGGSMLSIGSAAGVALMGISKGKYTFFSHLRWTPAIMAGYFASVLVHYWLNAA